MLCLWVTGLVAAGGVQAARGGPSAFDGGPSAPFSDSDACFTAGCTRNRARSPQVYRSSVGSRRYTHNEHGVRRSPGWSDGRCVADTTTLCRESVSV